MTIQLYLYTTSHCHLCEHAESIVASLAHRYDMQWAKVEIADDATLLERYEVKIPLLKRLDSGAEIGWPFNESDVENLLMQKIGG